MGAVTYFYLSRTCFVTRLFFNVRAISNLASLSGKFGSLDALVSYIYGWWDQQTALESNNDKAEQVYFSN